MRSSIKQGQRGRANGPRGNPVGVELLENRRHLDGGAEAVKTVPIGLDPRSSSADEGRRKGARRNEFRGGPTPTTSGLRTCTRS
jgi:hypothetical protein